MAETGTRTAFVATGKLQGGDDHTDQCGPEAYESGSPPDIRNLSGTCEADAAEGAVRGKKGAEPLVDDAGRGGAGDSHGGDRSDPEDQGGVAEDVHGIDADGEPERSSSFGLVNSLLILVAIHGNLRYAQRVWIWWFVCF